MLQKTGRTAHRESRIAGRAKSFMVFSLLGAVPGARVYKADKRGYGISAIHILRLNICPGPLIEWSLGPIGKRCPALRMAMTKTACHNDGRIHRTSSNSSRSTAYGVAAGNMLLWNVNFEGHAVVDEAGTAGDLVPCPPVEADGVAVA